MRSRVVLWIFGMAIPAFSAGALEVGVKGGTGVYYGEEQNNKYNSVGGSVRWYFSDRFSVEPGISFLRVDNAPRDTLYWVTVGVSHDFVGQEHRVVPSWFWEVGLAKVVGTLNPPSTSYYPTVGLGLNVKIFLSDRIFIAPRVRATEFLRSVDIGGSVGFVLRRSR